MTNVDLILKADDFLQKQNIKEPTTLAEQLGIRNECSFILR